jgi:hypothetical protein
MIKNVSFAFIILSLFLFGCHNIPSDKVMANIGHERNLNSTKIIDKLTQTPCGSIEIYPGVTFYNITGKMTARTKEGAILYMTSVKDMTFNNSIYAAKNCFPVWRVRMNDSFKFMIPDVPPGRYVFWLSSSQFADSQGFPMLDEKNELDIAFYGGDSQYSLIVFEIHS